MANKLFKIHNESVVPQTGGDDKEKVIETMKSRENFHFNAVYQFK